MMIIRRDQGAHLFTAFSISKSSPHLLTPGEANITSSRSSFTQLSRPVELQRDTRTVHCMAPCQVWIDVTIFSPLYYFSLAGSPCSSQKTICTETNYTEASLCRKPQQLFGISRPAGQTQQRQKEKTTQNQIRCIQLTASFNPKNFKMNIHPRSTLNLGVFRAYK